MTIPKLVQDDPWLEPYAEEIQRRINSVEERINAIKKDYATLAEYAGAHHFFGLHLNEDGTQWIFREWAPHAEAIHLTGEFNEWDRASHPLEKKSGGIWEITIPAAVLKPGTSFKMQVTASNGVLDRIPAYIQRVVQNPETHDFAAVAVEATTSYPWTDQDFDGSAAAKMPIIYEAHIGMATEEERVGTYREFADNILPRIKALGYNTVQLMAIQEHPYYGSFGYHVSSFFAASSRFGTIEDLKYLVNTAHGLGLAVIMDLVHSHAVKNIAEGLNLLDGSEEMYFHAGGRGDHGSWDSKLFNYGREEVIRFLLSNVRYWLETFHFDGYRFDGVTSLLYFHHGDFTSFDHYDKYFKYDVDWDALLYLQLANTLIHEIKPNAISIAEDMSGMPGMSRNVSHGGLGFDYRLGMGLPDFWIKYLKEKRDEEWDIHEMFHTMTNRRYREGTIAYAESHDQAIVGDKTIAFWLMDKEMYWHMQKGDDHMVIDRGIALHKMIRLFTAALGGEGYLNFIGNEFGHPEWIDFPREGNGWSYKYARRQWSLADNPDLKYHYFSDFDRDFIHVLRENHIFSSEITNQLHVDEHNKVVIFEKNYLIFIFNFHPDHAIPDYRFMLPKHLEGIYEIILDSDDPAYGGHGRIEKGHHYHVVEEEGQYSISVYIPNRTAVVLAPVK